MTKTLEERVAVLETKMNLLAWLAGACFVTLLSMMVVLVQIYFKLTVIVT